MARAEDSHLGSTLRMLRVNAGLSVRALAKEVGVSAAYLSRVENGHDPSPTPERLLALAKALDISPSLLLELAHQTGAALSDYLERVPAANGFFLEVARRRLDAAQLARMRQFMDTEFGHDTSGPGRSTPLQTLVGNRIVLKADCQSLEEAVHLGVARLIRDAGQRKNIAKAILERENASSTALGDGVCVPHSYASCVEGSRASLVTVNNPLAGDTPDGVAIRVLLILLSSAPGQEHLEALAKIARLASHHLISRIHAASKPTEVKRVFRELELAS